MIFFSLHYFSATTHNPYKEYRQEEREEQRKRETRHSTSSSHHLAVPTVKQRSSSADRNSAGYYYEDLTVESSLQPALRSSSVYASGTTGYSSEPEGVTISGFRARVKTANVNSSREKKGVRFASPVQRMSTPGPSVRGGTKGSQRGHSRSETPSSYYKRFAY